MTVQEATMLYRAEREKRSAPCLPASWTLTIQSRKTQYALGDGGYITHIEPAE